MPWFLVDDSLPDHPKIDELLDERDGFAAVGLWTVCGAWSMRHLTDGYVPLSRIRRLRGRARHADLLVKHGLWERFEDGYQFHDWTNYQPTKAAILAKRQARAEAGRKGGLASGESRREANAPSKPEANASQYVAEPLNPQFPDPNSQIPSPSQRKSARPPEASPPDTPKPLWIRLWDAWWDLTTNGIPAGDSAAHREALDGYVAELCRSLAAANNNLPDDPVEVFRGAARAFLDDPGTSRKRLGLRVFLAQFSDWAKPRPVRERDDTPRAPVPKTLVVPERDDSVTMPQAVREEMERLRKKAVGS